MKHKQSHNLGEDKILSLIIKLSIPSTAAMLINALFNVVDTIFVGRLGKNAIAALSISFPLQLIAISLAVGTGVGVTSLISRSLGERDVEKADHIGGYAMTLALMVSCIFSIVGLLFTDPVLKLFGATQALLPYTREYMITIFAGGIFIFFPIIANSVMRGEGNTLTPMKVMMISALTNIVLDPLLIFGIGPFPQMGIQGAALATIIARAISAVFAAYYFMCGRSSLHFKWTHFQPSWPLTCDIYKVGGPSAIMQLMGSALVAITNNVLKGYGETAIAAMGIYWRLQSLAFMPVFGINQGIMPLVGFNFGAKKFLRVREAALKGALVATVVMTAVGILFWTIPGPLMLLFNNDPLLVLMGEKIIRMVSAAYLIIAPEIIFSGVFQAMGKGIPALTVSILRQGVVYIPLVFILPPYLGLWGVWLAAPISEVVSTVVATIWMEHEFRKLGMSLLKVKDE